MILVDALGDACPVPVVKTKKALQTLQGAGKVCTLVDNEIAVQNLTKMAHQKGYAVKSEQLAPQRYQVILTVGENTAEEEMLPESCLPCRQKNKVAVLSSETMGQGDDVLGRLLMKGFIFALTQQEQLPETVLLYNSGAKLTCSEEFAEDFQFLESQGVEILTCGTCLSHYQLADKLKAGSVTNMYTIVEKMLQAEVVIKP